jgi:hypothetical protein
VVASHGLLNGPGVSSLDGLNVPAPYFDENMPLRDGVPLTVGLADGTTRTIVSPVINDIEGAMAIQQVFDNWEWVSLGGDPVAYAPYLQKDPLSGVDAKSMLVQFAKGDVYAPNPTTTAFLRAGDLADQATYYRYDLTPVYSQDPNLRTPVGYPHTYAALASSANPMIKAIALAAQQQIATFFASDGATIIQPPGVPAEYFEVGIEESELPEGLNYTVIAAPLAPVGAAVAASGSLTGTNGMVAKDHVLSGIGRRGRYGGDGLDGGQYNRANAELLDIIVANKAKGKAADDGENARKRIGQGSYNDVYRRASVSIDALAVVFDKLADKFDGNFVGLV